jgi:glycine/D-amino acid oxidase-like deaminating enzyme/nitrite reductase/ring-hydroxylating ferredoxin subunit
MESSGTTLSAWAFEIAAPKRRFRPLGMDTRADVVIIGGGIAGLSTAYMLAKEKVDVIVIDDGPIGGGETERTTAHLASAMDDRFFELERMHGREGARIAYQSHAAAIDVIEEIVQARAIDCDFSRLDGWLFCGTGQSPDILQRELEAARRAGFNDVEMHDRVPELAYDTGLALRFPRQGQIHPLKYLLGLAEAATDEGARIHTGHHAAEIEGGDAPRVLTTDGRVVHARTIVVCTNTPVNDRFAIHTKQAAYRTYVCAFAMPVGAVPLSLFWDTEDPYHYVRIHPGGGPRGEDLLIVGGEDHKTGHDTRAEARWAALYDWTVERFPMAELVGRWSGQVMEPFDSLAYIGRNPTGPENIFIATGDSGQGMTHGTIAGVLLSSLIREIDHPWAELYDPARKPTGALGTYAAENVDAARHYTDYLLPAQYQDADEIPHGAGGVVRRGLRPVAVYCDDHGVHSSCSAVCPHLGGVVQWNEGEKTWDCPVHGSRFDKHGHVLNGPANTDLTPVPEPAEETTPLLIGEGELGKT